MQRSPHQERNIEVQVATGYKAGQLKVGCLEEGVHYKFLGELKRLRTAE